MRLPLTLLLTLALAGQAQSGRVIWRGSTYMCDNDGPCRVPSPAEIAAHTQSIPATYPDRMDAYNPYLGETMKYPPATAHAVPVLLAMGDWAWGCPRFYVPDLSYYAEDSEGTRWSSTDDFVCKRDDQWIKQFLYPAWSDEAPSASAIPHLASDYAPQSNDPNLLKHFLEDEEQIGNVQRRWYIDHPPVKYHSTAPRGHKSHARRKVRK